MSRNYLSMNPFELHKRLINHYVLNRKGATAHLSRDTSKDKRDFDIIRENHKFLWEDHEVPSTWEERLAKKYYDKLFKEFCITDLSRYKENKFAMRWQTEQELVCGKGQFICGAKNCTSKNDLKTWEVNFGYIEHGEKKYALVKLRLCLDCSLKLNYKTRRKEIKRGKTKKSNQSKIKSGTNPESISPMLEVSPRDEKETETEEVIAKKVDEESASFWKGPAENIEEVSREDEFEEYLSHLLL